MRAIADESRSRVHGSQRQWIFRAEEVAAKVENLRIIHEDLPHKSRRYGHEMGTVLGLGRISVGRPEADFMVSPGLPRLKCLLFSRDRLPPRGI
jgi:hypothetical protein